MVYINFDKNTTVNWKRFLYIFLFKHSKNEIVKV